MQGGWFFSCLPLGAFCIILSLVFLKVVFLKNNNNRKLFKNKKLGILKKVVLKYGSSTKYMY